MRIRDTHPNDAASITQVPRPEQPLPATVGPTGRPGTDLEAFCCYAYAAGFTADKEDRHKGYV